MTDETTILRAMTPAESEGAAGRELSAAYDQAAAQYQRAEAAEEALAEAASLAAAWERKYKALMAQLAALAGQAPG